jgi:hypothetical protein
MTPVIRPSSRTGTDGYLISDQAAIAVLLSAFIFGAGSFTTIRRRRLASPTSILRIEATHPHVKCRAVRVRTRQGNCTGPPVEYLAPRAASADPFSEFCQDDLEQWLAAMAQAQTGESMQDA